jgi:hypothetical protein
MAELIDQVKEFLASVSDSIDRNFLLDLFNGISLTGVSDFNSVMIDNPSLCRDTTFFAAKYRRLCKLKEKELKNFKHKRLFELREASEEGRIRQEVGFSLPSAMIENYVESCDKAQVLEAELIELDAISRMLSRLDYQAEGRTNIIVQLSVNRRQSQKEEF